MREGEVYDDFDDTVGSIWQDEIEDHDDYFNVLVTDSRLVAEIEYDTDILTVTLIDGSVYAYENVDPQTAKAFRQSDSKGHFFNAHIKNRFHLI